MFQGRPRTSTCSHNFFGVRLEAPEIAPNAYPTLEIRCKLRGLRNDCGVSGACYSNPGWRFELVTSGFDAAATLPRAGTLRRERRVVLIDEQDRSRWNRTLIDEGR